MSYQVLARKWRPRTFGSLVGQEHVVKALTHALASQRLHHAYLFTGTRGVGKTTIARILAKALNCEKGVTPEPCGVCSSCVEIDAGRFVDLLEVDAATNTRVDEMRQLLENAVYTPTRGRYKVYVIDEVHMLSNSAFNAMLKTLEEPPEHVKFILATTDPQKIPVTVLSRCLQFNLKQMPPVAVHGHLGHVLDTEGVTYDAGALSLISRSANGSMRDALSLLDQAIAHGAGKVEESSVRAMLGSVSQTYLHAILDQVLEGNASGLVGVAADMAIHSYSFSNALQELSALLTRIQIAQLAPETLDDIEEDLESQKLKDFAKAFPPEFIQLAYQITLHGRDELPMAPDEYSGFVMTLLRLCCFRPATLGEWVGEHRPARVTAAVSPVEKASVPVPTPKSGVTEEVQPEQPKAIAKRPESSSEVGLVSGRWAEIVDALALTGLPRTLAQNCELRLLDQSVCVLRLDPAHAHLKMKPAQEKLQQALREYLGNPVEVRFEVAGTDAPTLAQIDAREKKEKQDQAVAAIRNDGFVQTIEDVLGGSVVETSIRPIV